MFLDRGVTIKGKLITTLSLLLSGFVYLYPWANQYFMLPFSPIEFFFLLCMLFCLATLVPFVFVSSGKIESILPEISANLYSFFYCGILGSFIVYIIACFGQLKAPVFTFALLTFGNDSLAWLVGKTLGKHRNVVAVSPNKSIEGFVGGMMGSLIGSVLAFFLFPEAGFESIWRALGLGLAMSIAVIIGDLVESALKRSAGVKDSSTIVPGRGGVLDSFDSLLFSAPVFVFVSLAVGFFPNL
jgi:phosphatidate cytidylyltransferase